MRCRGSRDLTLITGSFDDTDGRVLTSALAAVLATLGGLAGSTVLVTGDHRRWLGQATIVSSGLALAQAIVLIWVPDSLDSEVLDRALGLTSTALLACAHASLIYGRRRRGDRITIRVLTRIAVGSASGAALLVGGLAVFATSDPGRGVWVLLGVLIVIAVLTTLLAPLTRWIGSTNGH